MRDPALLFDLDGTLVDSVYQHVLGSAIRALLPRDGDHVAARLGRDRDMGALERLCFGERGSAADPFPATAGDTPQAVSGRAPYVVGGLIYHDAGTASTGLFA
jgi:beta-phosphoglucomutase-like phosphatase (HAD superfamily)